MSKILKNKKIIIVFFLVNSFILNLAIGTISNYSANIFILKCVSSILLFLLIFIDTRINRIDIQNLLKENNPRKLAIILILFIGYLSLTLIYSNNPAYGAQKILNFLISTIPSIFAFYYLVITNSKERFGVFIYSIVVITIVSVTYIIFDYPFEQSTIYEYTAGRWSHVIYGRIIGSIAVVLFLYLMWMIEKRETRDERRKKKESKWKVLSIIIFTSISVYGLYISSLRSAMLGLVLFVVLGAAFLVYELIARSEKRAQRRYQLAGIVAVIIFTLSFIILLPKPGIIETRFDNLIQIENFKFGGDGAINSRIEELRISKELFLEHPLIGVGFGGYRSYNEFTEVVRYPHNIFVEMGVEGGVVGVVSSLCVVLCYFEIYCIDIHLLF